MAAECSVERLSLPLLMLEDKVSLSLDTYRQRAVGPQAKAQELTGKVVKQTLINLQGGTLSSIDFLLPQPPPGEDGGNVLLHSPC